VKDKRDLINVATSGRIERFLDLKSVARGYQEL
jgi:hypothetical protein